MVTSSPGHKKSDFTKSDFGLFPEAKIILKLNYTKYPLQVPTESSEIFGRVKMTQTQQGAVTRNEDKKIYYD